MTKLSFGAHPYLLGFEQLERLVERTAKSGAEGYPPFNIEAVAEKDRKSTRLNSSHRNTSRMPSSA